MKVFLHYNPDKGHQQRYMELLATGMRACGDQAVPGMGWDTADALVVWGERERPPWHEGPVLYLEAGFLNGTSGDYVRDRLQYVSLGWNGVAGLADPLPPDLDAQRWFDMGVERSSPIEVDPDGHVLVCLQHREDAAARGADFEAIVAEAKRLGTVRVREHPVMMRRSGRRQPPIAVDLEGCKLCVTWSSTAAVDALLAGVPTVALSERSIAYPVTAHSLTDPWDQCADALQHLDDWFAELAWRQWRAEELRDGSAWRFFRRCASGL